MTAEDVQKTVKEIHRLRAVDDAAHSLEDALYLEVMKAVAGGDANAQDLAVEALKTRQVKFSRWCG